MARPSTVLVIFILAINSSAILMMGTGTAQMIGVDASVDMPSDTLEDAKAEAGETSTGSSIGGTLFGMYNALVSSLGVILDLVVAGPAMLARAGVPTFITNFLSAIFLFVISFDVISFLRGFSL